MFKNYLKIAIRNMRKNKGYSFINIFGLALGMACFILISMWVTDELSYDRFHKNIDNLYRVNTVLQDGRIIPNSSLMLGREMNDKYPEIEAYTNFIPWARSLVTYNNKSYDESDIYLVDPAFFTMFSIEFVAGDPSTALPDMYSLIMTEETAIKYFGDANPIGKRVYSDVFERDFTVTAVVKKMPSNSTLQFNIVSSIELMPLQRRESWEFSGWTYIQLNENVTEDSFNKKIKNFYAEYIDPEYDPNLKLQNYATLHLYETGDAGLVKLVYIFSAIAIFVLIIACANFMNLSTARATKRALEVGVRKVSGAYKRQLIYQFLGESILISFIATLFAVILVELALPVYNNFSGKSLAFIGGDLLNILFGLIGLALVVGLFAGIYPSFILSSFKPVTVLKGKTLSNGKGASFRKLLTIGQFTISIGLIICTLLVKDQMNYLKNADLGMNRDMVLTLPNNDDLIDKFDAYKAELLRNPKIKNLSASATEPFNVNQMIGVNWEGHMEEEGVSMRYTMIDYDFFDTMEMELILGRDYSPSFATDSTESVIVNESAVELMGFDDPIGKVVYFGHPAFPEEKRFVKIIGVVKDFHFRSLHNTTGPFIFNMHRPWHSFIYLKIKPGNIQQTIAGIEDVTKKFAPEYPFQFEFLDEAYNRLYLMEIKISELFNVFAGLAIIISCLGLFGLAAFTAEQKTKEVGIRKVLGSSVGGIVLMLSKEFVKWIVIANLVAWPIAYYLIDAWLMDFAYKIDIGIWVFLISGIIALVIAIVTVAFQTIKAAIANPIESLRYE
ncbi:ABC transporter permease [Bacteroidota bacterium]